MLLISNAIMLTIFQCVCILSRQMLSLLMTHSSKGEMEKLVPGKEVLNQVLPALAAKREVVLVKGKHFARYSTYQYMGRD